MVGVIRTAFTILLLSISLFNPIFAQETVELPEPKNSTYFDERSLKHLKPTETNCTETKKWLGTPSLTVKQSTEQTWIYRYIENIFFLSYWIDKPLNNSIKSKLENEQSHFRKLTLKYNSDCVLENYQYLSTFNK